MFRLFFKQQITPMKKNYTLKNPILNPKKSTVDFLLNFSKSVVVMKANNKKFIVSKN